ncbi:MAG: ATPase [Bacteroidales bacterium]|nr:ATPase [Bacteroidales bacterium]
MILIADSGSTKTEWCLIDKNSKPAASCITAGINPMYQDGEAILKTLQQQFNLSVEEPPEIFFYGAGCISNSINRIVLTALKSFFNCHSVTVDTDLLGAARSLCGDSEGIACILGTGSNSCYYNGREIAENVSPLGYILGDEGSGAVIGRKFIADLLKNQLPERIVTSFFDTCKLSRQQIMEQVYKKPFPNRFLAQFTGFIHSNLHESELYNLVKTSFTEFFNRNVSQYNEAHHLPVHFTGSVAFHFSPLLRETAEKEGYSIGSITENPMEGLIRYHINNTHRNGQGR